VLNVLIVGTASYEGVTYMDSATFCGTSCHVMKPQWAAYQDSPHSHVDCVECHVGAGMSAYLAAKVNGTKQRAGSSLRPQCFPSMKVTWGTYPNNIGHNG
jgi:nitrate/TMAO reductase-like tetraheme cytochrome c subunit